MNGGFIPKNSALHRADPLCKLLCFLLLITAFLLCKTPWGYGINLLFLAGCIPLSRLGLRPALGNLPQIWHFFLLIFFMNLLFFEAENPLFHWGIFSLSAEGALQGLRTVSRLIPILIAANLLLATTSPTDLIGALESLLYPLKFLGVPIGEIAMIMGVALQFIPLLSQEAENIRLAQTARGARFESKRLHHRAAALLPLVVPLFVAAFRRADELSVAMESRGYRRNCSLPPRKRCFHLQEGIALPLCLALCILQFFI